MVKAIFVKKQSVMKLRILSISLFLIFVINPLRSQTAAVDSSILQMAEWVKALNTFGRFNPQEKVYLHFDNTGYYLGETIWFKAYVVSAPQLRPTEMSKVLYVELLTPEGRVVETKKLKIVDGQCHGEFLLTDGTLVGGFYEVRAYTRVMLNWGDDVVFSRVFPVFDTPKREGEYEMEMTERARSKALPEYREKSPKTNVLDLAFFPEGGEMVAGLPSVVAFKATGKDGQGCDVKGVVRDKAGNLITEFVSEHRGMGKFLLIPDAATDYEALVVYGGKEYKYFLPKARKQGYAMTVSNLRKDKLQVQLQRTADVPGEIVGVTVMCRGIAYAFDVADMRSKTSARLQFAKSEIPSGVMQVTLFNARGEVLSERLAFHYSGRHIGITVDSVKPLYKPFEEINLGFKVRDGQGVPCSRSFSLAVRDYDSEVPSFYQSNILTNLLLESDLRGYIEDIPYYFEADDAVHRNALDLLMLVQGWRRYEWRQMAGVEPFSPLHHVEEGILVKGQVLRYRLSGSRPEPGVDVSVWLYSPEFNSSGSVKTDDDGRFVFLSDSDVWGRCDMILRTQSPDKNGKMKDRDLLIELDRVFSPKAAAYFSEETSLPDSNLNRITYVTATFDEPVKKEKQLSMSEKVHDLDEVSVTAQQRGLADRPTISYNVSDEEDKLIDTHDTDYADGIPALLERINPYFAIKSDDGEDIVCTYKNRPVKFVFYNANRYMGDWADAAMLAGLDMPVEGRLMQQNANEEESVTLMPGDSAKNEPSIRDISNHEVKKIEIVEMMNAVLIKLYGYPYAEQRKEMKGMRMTTLQGYSVPQEFYHIDYGRGALPDRRDFRRTLYWNPSVPVGTDGRAFVSFYNSNSPHRLSISAETLSSDGVPGMLVP